MAFSGPQLKVAREARGLTPAALAAAVGVTRQAVYGWERGTSVPRAAAAEAIAAVLGFPAAFFDAEVKGTLGAVFFRSRASATRRARASATAKLRIADMLVERVEEFVELPDADVPHLPVPAGHGDRVVEDIARGLRTAWGLGDGPIDNLSGLLERKGSVVVRVEEDAKLHAYSSWCRGRPLIFASLAGTAVRNRFSLAHELGHIVMHRERVADDFLETLELFRRIEREADRFAGAFLVPAGAFSDMGKVTLDSLLRLKSRWRVSVQALVKRCQALGLINDPTPYWIQLSKRGWRMREPLDDLIPQEAPFLLAEATRLLAAEGHGFGCLPDLDVEKLAGLEGGTLADSRKPQLRLKVGGA